MNVKILKPQKSEKSESEKSFLVWCDGEGDSCNSCSKKISVLRVSSV